MCASIYIRLVKLSKMRYCTVENKKKGNSSKILGSCDCAGL